MASLSVDNDPTGQNKKSVQLPDPILGLLASRGILGDEQVQKFLSPTLQDLKDPESLLGMRRACNRLCAALENSDNVLVFGDYDLDGSTGAALLKQGLEEYGLGEVQVLQPDRLKDGYGLSPEKIEIAYQRGAQVIVTVDVGITAVDAALRARELGIDLIITDHHLMDEVLPLAFSVVNPNQPGCPSELGYLSGTGVGFYLLLGMRKALRRHGIGNIKWSLKKYLDLFAIGTIGDLVPLVEDNRVLIKHGLKQLESTENHSLRALLDLMNRTKDLNSQDVSFGIAPKLNALSRLGSTILPIDFYLGSQPSESYEMAAFVIKENDRRKKLQLKLAAKAMKKVKSKDLLTMIWGAEYHKGIIGLVANELMGKYSNPTFVGYTCERGEVTFSGRLPETYQGSLLDILKANEDLMLKFGGHSHACGFSVKEENCNQLKERFFDFVNENPFIESETEVCEYDLEMDFSEINFQFMHWLGQLEPFGQGFSLPKFLFKNVKVRSVKVLKDIHLKLTLYQKGLSLSALYFSPPQKVFDKVVEAKELDIIATPQKNTFRGENQIDLHISSVL